MNKILLYVVLILNLLEINLVESLSKSKLNKKSNFYIIEHLKLKNTTPMIKAQNYNYRVEPNSVSRRAFNCEKIVKKIPSSNKSSINQETEISVETEIPVESEVSSEDFGTLLYK
ncbi:hypothetical protein MXB_1394 [Myxobolus squamalis]|nr:hypothetical protein MXB_1394 [Myxobolus squamalis]